MSNNRKDYKIAIIASRMPPYYSGAGLSAYKHARRLLDQDRLGLVMTEKINSTAQKPGSPIEVEDLSFDLVIRLETSKEFMNKLISRRYFRFIYLLLFNFFTFIFTGYNLVKYRNQFDILHCYSVSNLSFYSIIWGKILGKKIITEITLYGSDDPESVKKNQGKFSKEYFVFLLSDKINCVSQRIMTSCKISGISENKLTLITRSVDTSRFYPLYDGRKKSMKKSLFGSSETKTCLFIGALTKRKGIDKAWEAFKKLNELNPSGDFLFVIIGDANKEVESHLYLSNITEQAKQMNLYDRVKFLGTVNDIEKYMQASDFLIFPSETEGSPNALLEAMGCGMVAVSNYIEGITADIINDGVNGVLVKDNNTKTYADAIQSLHSDKLLFKTISENAVKKINENYSAQKIYNLYKLTYISLYGNQNHVK